VTKRDRGWHTGPDGEKYKIDDDGNAIIPSRSLHSTLTGMLEGSNGRSYFERCSFSEISGIKNQTAKYISIDTYEEYERKHGYLISQTSFHGTPDPPSYSWYVLRLGQGCFGMVECDDVKTEYFVHDENLFPGIGEEYISSARVEDLFIFSLLEHDEGTLIELGLATGIIQHGLGIDSEEPIQSINPRGSYKFHIMNPHSQDSFLYDGQVEIDSVFSGEVDSKNTLFVVEAKKGLPNSSLAKHKFVYPAIALASKEKIPRDYNVVPCYVKSWKNAQDNTIHYCIAKFNLPEDPRIGLVDISRVSQNGKAKHLFMQDPFAQGSN
jgi:hypothetical protein